MIIKSLWRKQMPDINRVIDEQLHYVRNIGCVVNIVDEEYNE